MSAWRTALSTDYYLTDLVSAFEPPQGPWQPLKPQDVQQFCEVLAYGMRIPYFNINLRGPSFFEHWMKMYGSVIECSVQEQGGSAFVVF